MNKWLGTVVLVVGVVLLVVVLARPRGEGAPAPEEAASARSRATGGLRPVPGVTPPGSHPSPDGAEGEGAAGPMHAMPVDENTRQVRAYPLTMRRLKDYAAAVKDLRAAGEQDPDLMARLRQPGPVGEEPAAMAARLEGIVPLKAILKRHGLGAIDLILVPQVVTLGQVGLALEQEGRPMPAEEANASAIALYRADLPAMDELAKAFRADLKVIRGR